MWLMCIRWRNSELSTGGSNYASLRKIKGAGFTQIGVSTIIAILHAIELQEHILVCIRHTLQSLRATPSCSHILVLVYMYAIILMHGTTMPLSSLSRCSCGLYYTDKDQESRQKQQKLISQLQERHPDFPVPGSTIPRNERDAHGGMVPGRKAKDSEYEL